MIHVLCIYYQICKRRVHIILDSFWCRQEKLSGIVWATTAQNWNKSPDRKSCQSGWPRWFGELTSVIAYSSPCPFLFTSATFRTLKCGSEPIRYVIIHFQDLRGASSLRYRNHAKISVPMCEGNPYQVWRAICYWRILILVYIFCLISIGLSLSDEANKMKFLNIERA